MIKAILLSLSLFRLYREVYHAKKHSPNSVRKGAGGKSFPRRGLLGLFPGITGTVFRLSGNP
jgi:hypothetical protein